MYRPQFHSFRNPNFNQWSPHLKPRLPFLRRNFTTNRFRPPGPLILQSDYNFWCETCDKGFQTLQILESHKSQHQKCNIDGCQFVAHPKVITKHIQMQHSTGLYKKIANLNNPEDIQKWREERKRKYPTKENIERKVAEVKEKLERGERMGIKYQNNNKRRNPDQLTDLKQKFTKGKNLKGHSNFRLRRDNNNLTPPVPKKICKTKPIKSEVYKLQAFAGIHQMIIDDDKNQEDQESQDSLIEDDIFCEELTTDTNASTQSKPTLCGALTSLVCNYGSSDEDAIPEKSDFNHDNKSQIDSQSECKIEEEKKVIAVQQPCINSNKDKSDDESGPEEIVTKKEKPENNISNNTCKKEKTIRTVKNYNANVKLTRKPKYQLPSTLLVKLLSREIEQERNIILQCVNYVVKNNFFDCGDNKG